jgi:hypothetical protein
LPVSDPCTQPEPISFSAHDLIGAVAEHYVITYDRCAFAFFCTIVRTQYRITTSSFCSDVFINFYTNVRVHIIRCYIFTLFRSTCGFFIFFFFLYKLSFVVGSFYVITFATATKIHADSSYELNCTQIIYEYIFVMVHKSYAFVVPHKSLRNNRPQLRHRQIPESTSSCRWRH